MSHLRTYLVESLKTRIKSTYAEFSNLTGSDSHSNFIEAEVKKENVGKSWRRRKKTRNSVWMRSWLWEKNRGSLLAPSPMSCTTSSCWRGSMWETSHKWKTFQRNDVKFCFFQENIFSNKLSVWHDFKSDKSFPRYSSDNAVQQAHYCDAWSSLLPNLWVFMQQSTLCTMQAQASSSPVLLGCCSFSRNGQ